MKVSMKALVELINCNTKHTATIQGTWEDYGAQMWWETIIINYTRLDHNGKEEKGSYQALSPRQHREIREGNFNQDDAQLFIKEILNRGW